MTTLKNAHAAARVRSLPVALWPAADREAWTIAVKPGQRLKRGGRAEHLKPISGDDLVCRYGYYLDHLHRQGLLTLDTAPAEQVRLANVEGYLTELKARVSSVTVSHSIYGLLRFSALIAPERNFDWLRDISNDLSLLMRPRSKFGRIVFADRIVLAGLTLIQEAAASSDMRPLTKARQIRNGLMIALLAMCPIRLKNFADLEIGRNFVNIKGRWWIVLAESETKENRADERCVDELLGPAIEMYLSEARLILGGPEPLSSALWLSSNDGSPLSYSAVEVEIKKTTLATVGVDINPHLFRACAATTVATYAGDNPHLGSALLHHTDATVNSAHYNRATSLTAAEQLRRILRNGTLEK